MAASELIEVLLREAAVCVSKRLDPDDMDAAVRLFSREFGETPGTELSDAFDRWISTQSDDQPAFKLPAPSTIRALMKLAEGRRSTAPGPIESALKFTPPRPEFLEAHRRFREIFRGSEFASLDETKDRHDHRPKRMGTGYDLNGNEILEWVEGPVVCPICGPAGDERRARIAELLAQLPEPQSSGTRPCVCDHGWIEVKDPGSRDVYPCRECNPYFWEWSGLESPGKGKR